MDSARQTAPGVPAGIGLVTILTVLLALVLAVFAALTLFTAQADARLSQANADAVTAYYAADALACAAQAEFAQGVEAELERTFPMTEAQSLYIHLRRTAEGGVERLAWQTVSSGQEIGGDTLPIWDGVGLPGE